MWYGVGLGLGRPKFVMKLFIMILTFVPPSNKTSSTLILGWLPFGYLAL